MQKNVASQKVSFVAYDATTGLPKTGDAANITAYVSKDSGAVTVLGDTSAAELDATNAKGCYSFDLTQGETNADMLVFTAKSSTANIYIDPLIIFTRPPAFNTSVAQTGDNFARLGAPAGASVSADVAAVKVDTAAILVDTGTTLDARIPAALVSGRMDSSVGAMAANVMTAAAAAPDLTTELQSGLSTLTAAQVNTEVDTALSDVGVTTTVTGRIDAAISSRGTGTALDAAGVRSAVGLASANLDTQLGDVPTNSELTTALGTADDATLAAIATLQALVDDLEGRLTSTRAGYLDNLGAALTEAYAADGANATLAELLYEIRALLSEFSISGTTLTAKKKDGSTTAATYTLDSSTAPTSITRAT
jgi:hypothetical protein